MLRKQLGGDQIEVDLLYDFSQASPAYAADRHLPEKYLQADMLRLKLVSQGSKRSRQKSLVCGYQEQLIFLNQRL